jgi:hypothetical protein
MSPSGNGVPTIVVEKILDTMKDVASSMKNTDTKMDQLEESFYKNLEKVADAMSDVGTKLNTPPRHIELSEKIDSLKTIVQQGIKFQEEKNQLLTNVIRTIKIGAALFGAAILVGSIFLGVVELTKKPDVTVIEKIERIEQNLNKHIEGKK